MTDTTVDKVTARDVLDSLHGRWPDDQYLFVEEAPQHSDRGGRKIDALVVSLWKSRGHELDAVEVKVSVSDWRRELLNPEKADWWWEHTNRYWIAVPSAIAATVRADLPIAWGLLAVNGGKCQEVVKAPKHSATEMPWPSLIGVMRAAADAGLGALGRARNAGYADGLKHGKEGRTGEPGLEVLRSQLASLQEVVKEFEAASGIDLGAAWGSVAEGRRLGEAAHLLVEVIRTGAPDRMLRPLALRSSALRDHADQLDRIRDAVTELLTVPLVVEETPGVPPGEDGGNT